MSAASKQVPVTALTDDPWLTVKDAALELGLSRHEVMKRAALGLLKTGTAAGNLVIDRASVAEHKAAMADASAPSR